MSHFHNIYLNTTGLILIAAAFVFFGILPQIARLSEINQNILVAKAELAQVSGQVSGYQRAAAELKTSSLLKDRLADIFPKRESMESLILGLEEAIAKSGAVYTLEITDHREEDFGLKAELAKPRALLVPALVSVEEVPYVLNLTGDFRELLDFFYYFENQPLFSEYSRLSFTAETEQDDQAKELYNTGRGTAVIEGVFFIRKD